MTKRVRAVVLPIVALAMLGLAGCDHYNCTNGLNFGSSTCSSSSISNPGGSTGGGSATAAFVFVADATGTSTTGTIDGYTLNTNASTFAPTPTYTAPPTPLGDGGVGMVVAQAKYLYTGFGSTDQIFGWAIGASGTLTALSGSPYAAPFMASVRSGFDTQSIATNPAGTLLFFSAQSLQSQVYVYQIGSSGALAAVAGSPFSVPFTGNLATDGLGKYLYITDISGVHTGSKVAAYAIASSGSNIGALTVVPGSPFVFPMWQVQGEPSGKFLIGTTGQSVAVNGLDNDNLYVFSIAASGSDAGAIAEVSGSPFTTQNSPLSIAVQSNTNGDLVYTFGVSDDNTAFTPVEGYTISSSGILTAASGSPFANAAVGYQGAFDQSGAFLFVYGGVEPVGTTTVTYQMGPFDVASAGALTQPVPTLTLTSGGYFAVTDPQ